VCLKTTNNPAKQRSSYGMFFTLHDNTRRTRSMGVLQSGQPLGMFTTASAQFVQKCECPRGTRATPVRGAIRQMSHMSGVAVAATAVTVAADDGVEGSASSSVSLVYRTHSGVRTQIHDLLPKPHNRLRCSPY